MFHSIRSFSIANVVVVGLALGAASPVHAKEKPITGEWTLTVEHLPLRLELSQKKQVVTGKLSPQVRRDRDKAIESLPWAPGTALH